MQDERLRTALILGGADCVFEDAESALQLFAPDVTIAVNDIGTCWSGRIDHWVSLHPEHFPKWIAKRKKAGLNQDYTVWAHEKRKSNGEAHAHVDRATEDWAGSSGLFAVKVAFELDCTRAVLAGVPMQKERGHFFDREPWVHVQEFLPRWDKRIPELRPKVRSMSGWTRSRLGAPTPDWLGTTHTPPATPA